MARVNKNIEYHEDKIPKRPISQDDILFLKALQQEMNTQDEQSQADPRYWTIIGTEREFGIDEEQAENSLFYIDDTCVAESVEEFAKLIQSHIPAVKSVQFHKGWNTYVEVVLKDKEKSFLYKSLYKSTDFIELYEDYGIELKVRNYRVVTRVYPGLFFLTRKEAEEHLEKNFYHYSSDARTYAMTAWRAPQVSQLYRILHETDFDLLAQACNNIHTHGTRKEDIKMTAGKFEKVSQEQFMSGCKSCFADAHIAQLWTDNYDSIEMPKRATKGSAGYDFKMPFDITIEAGGTVTIPTGIRCKMNEDFVLMLFPRSGLGFKYGLHLKNTAGIIDSDYYNADNEGHIMVRLVNPDSRPIEFKKGAGFAQGIFLMYGRTEDDEDAGQRTGGFGSTGA